MYSNSLSARPARSALRGAQLATRMVAGMGLVAVLTVSSPVAAEQAWNEVDRPAAAVSPELEALEARLRDTPAIGLLIKLELRSRIETLTRELGEARQSGGQRAGLRRRFDLLVEHVLALVREGDPALYRDIDRSRGRIWDALNGGNGLARS